MVCAGVRTGSCVVSGLIPQLPHQSQIVVLSPSECVVYVVAIQLWKEWDYAWTKGRQSSLSPLRRHGSPSPQTQHYCPWPERQHGGPQSAEVPLPWPAAILRERSKGDALHPGPAMKLPIKEPRPELSAVAAAVSVAQTPGISAQCPDSSISPQRNGPSKTVCSGGWQGAWLLRGFLSIWDRVLVWGRTDMELLPVLLCRWDVLPNELPPEPGLPL